MEVGHFKIYGFLVYCHVPFDKRMKFNSIVEKGIFVGYNKTLKVYQIYVPSLKKTMVRRDVRFKEEKDFRKSYDVPTVVSDQGLVSPKEEQESQG